MNVIGQLKYHFNHFTFSLNVTQWEVRQHYSGRLEREADPQPAVVGIMASLLN